METNAYLRSFDPRRLGVSSLAGRRALNEDAWAAPPAGADVSAGACFVIADGVGGQARGDLAATTAASVVARVYYERRAAGDAPAAALLAAVAAANSAVYQLGRSLNVERMGCTLAAAALADGQLHVAHVGDARAYLWLGGQLYPLTRDHSWVQEQVDRGLIAAADAAQHELRHVVTRVLGNEATVEATAAAPLTPGAGDALLLTSDGVHDLLTPEQMAGLMSGTAPAAAAEALTAAALNAGSEDNVTALVALVGADNGAAVAAAPATVQGRAYHDAPAAGALPATAQGAAYRPAPGRRAALLPALLGAALLVAALALAGSLLSRLGAEARPAATVPASGATVPGLMPAATTTVIGPGGEPTSTPSTYPYPGPTAAGANVTEPIIEPMPAPTTAARVCVIVSEAYIWTGEQAADLNLNEPAYDVIAAGQVTILGGPTDMPAYPSGNVLPFYLVRSTVNNVEGWVLTARVNCAQ